MSRHTDQIQSITQTLEDYFAGIYEGDTDKLEAVFLPESSLFSTTDGPLTALAIADYLDIVRNRPSPASTGAVNTDIIYSIDIAAPEMALAKVGLSIPPKFFTDYLTLLKVDGRWRIAAKAFTYRVEN